MAGPALPAACRVATLRGVSGIFAMMGACRDPERLEKRTAASAGACGRSVADSGTGTAARQATTHRHCSSTTRRTPPATRPDSAGSSATGSLSIRNVFVLGAPVGRNLVKGQSASLFLAVINVGAPDKLISISAPGSATAVSLPTGGVPVVYGRPVLLTGPKPQLVLVGLTRTIRSGSSLKLNLTFQKAGTISLVVPVMPRAVQSETYAPPQPSLTGSSLAVGTPTPTGTPKSHGAHPSPTPST